MEEKPQTQCNLKLIIVKKWNQGIEVKTGLAIIISPHIPDIVCPTCAHCWGSQTCRCHRRLAQLSLGRKRPQRVLAREGPGPSSVWVLTCLNWWEPTDWLSRLRVVVVDQWTSGVVQLLLVITLSGSQSDGRDIQGNIGQLILSLIQK